NHIRPCVSTTYVFALLAGKEERSEAPRDFVCQPIKNKDKETTCGGRLLVSQWRSPCWARPSRRSWRRLASLPDNLATRDSRATKEVRRGNLQVACSATRGSPATGAGR